MPAVREANRIVQTLLIPASEIARREKAVRAVIHSGYLEGFPDDMPWQSQLWMYARGKSPANNLSAYADEGRQIPRQPDHSLSVRRTFPRMVADHTGPHPPEPPRHDPHRTGSRCGLQVSIEEVGELFEANRLMSFDLNGEERIPDWQLVTPALPEFGDPSSLLPGLDVLYAAAPQPLLDAAAMTEFMTTPSTSSPSTSES